MLFVSVSLEANYCIQVMTANESEKNFVIEEASSNKYSQFDTVRVEKRGRYLVFRIGDYRRYGDGVADMRAIRSIKKGSYLRKCDFDREKTLYIQQHNRRSRVQSYERPRVSNVQEEYYRQDATPKIYKKEPKYIKSTYTKQKPKKVYKTQYTKKKELTYTTSDQSLWGDCKKCFIPVYEEDATATDSTQVQEKPKEVYIKREPRQVQEDNEIEVHVQEVEPDEGEFWADEKTINYNNRSHSRPKAIYKSRQNNNIKHNYNSNNKYERKTNQFNIDEQFLP